MPNNRDDFSERTKDIMAKRVGYRCSNPQCRKLTCGPTEDPAKSSSIGVAAHICAAAPGGKRFDSKMTPEERKNIDNGIWLCQSCSKLIDSDDLRYSVDFLHNWKRIAEEIALMDLETASPVQTYEKDIQLIKFYIQCFDRPAFQHDIYQEGRMEAFDKALEDTIIALNTGILRTRDGAILKRAEGKSFVRNPDWNEKLNNVVDILTAIRRRLKIAEKEHAYWHRGDDADGIYYFEDRELAEWFNASREEVLKIMSSICKEIGVRELRYPKHRNL